LVLLCDLFFLSFGSFFFIGVSRCPYSQVPAVFPPSPCSFGFISTVHCYPRHGFAQHGRRPLPLLCRGWLSLSFFKKFRRSWLQENLLVPDNPQVSVSSLVVSLLPFSSRVSNWVPFMRTFEFFSPHSQVSARVTVSKQLPFVVEESFSSCPGLTIATCWIGPLALWDSTPLPAPRRSVCLSFSARLLFGSPAPPF